MIATQVVTHDSNEVFSRFSALVGRETWKRQIDSIERRRQHPLLGDYPREQYQLVRTIERYAEIFELNGAMSEHEIVAESLDCAVYRYRTYGQACTGGM